MLKEEEEEDGLYVWKDMWNGQNHDYDSIPMNFISQSFQFGGGGRGSG